MPQTYYLGARSLFVTVTAWVTIVLAALAWGCGLVEQAALASLVPGFGGTLSSAGLPPLSSLLLSYLPWVNGAGLVLSTALLITGVGLLRRLEWARRTFIGLMGVVIVVNLCGLWLQHELAQSLVHSALSQSLIPAAALDLYSSVLTAARAGGVLATLSLSIFMGWVIRRLCTPIVLQEFAA
jgi:hypothetical protein